MSLSEGESNTTWDSYGSFVHQAVSKPTNRFKKV